MWGISIKKGLKSPYLWIDLYRCGVLGLADLKIFVKKIEKNGYTYILYSAI